MRLWKFQPHRDWTLAAEAYADGTLDAARSPEFRRHLESCSRCQAMVQEVSGLRSALHGLPDREAPRSFRLTPGMLAASEPGDVTERAVVSKRLRAVNTGMRFAAGLSAAALAAVIVLDFTLPDADESKANFQAAGAEPMIAEDQDSGPDTGLTMEAAPAERSSEEMPTAPPDEPDDAASGQSAPDDDALSPEPTPMPVQPEGERELTQGYDEVPLADAQLAAASTGDDTDDRDRILRGLQIGLGAALVAAIGGILFFPARRRS